MKKLLAAFFLLPALASATHIKSPSAGIDVTSERVVSLDTTIGFSTDATFITAMIATAHKPGPRIVFINSSGGYVDNAKAMIEALEIERSYGVKLICVVHGIAYSMAFNLLTHCDVRLATKDSTFVFHKIYSALWDPAVRLTPNNLRKEARRLQAIDEPYKRRNMKALNITSEDYDAAADVDKVWTAKDLFLRGYLHGIVKFK